MDTKKLRQKILDLAIRGKLVPQDPNDEPASVLLERIRAEKERLIKEGKIKRSKKSASDTPHYPEEMPFEVPNGWCWCRFSDVADSCLGKMLDKDKNQGQLYPYLRNINVRWGRFEMSDILQMRFEPEEEERYTIRKGDLVVCEGGEPGRCAIWSSEEPIRFQKALHRVRCYDGVSALYLSYILRLYVWNGMIEPYFSGSTIKHLTGDSLSSLFIPIAPFSEQQRIVAEIEKWFAVIDTLEACQNDLEAAIKQAKSKILDLAIHGKLVPQDPNDESAIELLRRINPSFVPCDNAHYENVPESWCAVPLGNICVLNEGEPITGKDYPYIDVKGLRTGNYTSKQSGKYVPNGTTLILVDGENSGEVFHTPVDGYQGSTMKVLDIDNNMKVQYVLYFVKLYQKALRENKVGSAIPHLNKKMFRELVIPVPPVEEQERIVVAIREYYRILDNISAEL